MSRTDNTSVVSYINHQGGIRYRALCKQATDILLWAGCHLLSIRAMHIPGLLNRGADMLSRKGIPQGEWRLHPESVRIIWNRYGRAEVDLFSTSENAHCPVFFSLSHSPLEGDALTSHWPAARLYAFPPIKILQLVHYARSGRSERQCYSLPRTGRTSLASQTWRNCWRHRPARSPSGRICYPRWTARCGTPTRNCGAFTCGPLRVIRGDERLTVSRARHTHGSTSTFYKTVICFKMGSVCEMVRSGSYWPGYLHRIGCSEFPAAQTGWWIVTVNTESLCGGYYRVSFPAKWAINRSVETHWWWVFLRGQKDYTPHVRLRFRLGTWKWC